MLTEPSAFESASWQQAGAGPPENILPMRNVTSPMFADASPLASPGRLQQLAHEAAAAEPQALGNDTSST